MGKAMGSDRHCLLLFQMPSQLGAQKLQPTGHEAFANLLLDCADRLMGDL